MVSSVCAHSWVEQLSVIAPNGTFIGAPGYARGNVLRQGGTNVDKAMVYLLPPDGRDPTQGILPSDPMCFPGHQQQATQTDGSPRLKAAAGDLVAVRYQENGHVTLPQNQPGKPDNRGTIYVYGTTQSSPNDKFLDIFGKWNADGSGGNKAGKLLATFNYDDGQCYQINGGQISTARQKQFPHQASQLMGADLWCQNDLALPSDAPSGKPYTLYWVWHWSTAPGAPGVPNGKTEIYTTCMDIDVQGAAANKAAVQFTQGQPVDRAAVPGQLSAIQAGKPMIAPTALPSSEKLSGNAPAPAASSATLSPNPQAPAGAPPASAAPQSPAAASPSAGAQPPAAQQPPAAEQPEVTKTVISTVYLPSPTSTGNPTAPHSTEPGVPTISLTKLFSGTATAMTESSTAPCKEKKRSKILGRAVHEHLAVHISSSAAAVAAQSTGSARATKPWSA